jgi:spore coat protein A
MYRSMRMVEPCLEHTPAIARWRLRHVVGSVAVGMTAAVMGAGCGSEPGQRSSESLGEVSQASVRHAQTPLDGATIPKFVDPVPAFNGRRINGAGNVSIDMREFQQRVLPASIYAARPAPFNAGSFLWGYAVNGQAPVWPTNTIEARQGTQTNVTYTNSLRQANGQPPLLGLALSQDLTLHWADPTGVTRANRCETTLPLPPACQQPYSGPVPAVAHLHGAEVLSAYDGHPDAWWTPGLAQRGPAYITNVYQYPNRQEATTLWFHDHALGSTRLTVYTGLAGFYLIRDTRDTGAATNSIGLPAGNYENEMLIADRQFDTDGQLIFPDGTPTSNPTGLNGPPPNPETHPFWIPEFFGDVITVNGKSWPFMRVEPRRYRLRFVNGSNARFYQMQLKVEVNGQPTAANGPNIWQIGSDGGFLNSPTNLDTGAGQHLFIAPAERADVIVDFAGQAGRRFILSNLQTALAPYPSGDPPDPATSGQVMEFRVDLPLQGADTSYNPANPGTRTLRASPIIDVKPTPARPADKKRQLALVEVEGAGGPEMVLLNNSRWDGNRDGTTTPIPGSISNGRGLNSTENPRVGSTEVWEIANLSEDAHPIHVHLIQFQIINRQNFDRDGYRTTWDAAFPGGTFKGVSYPAGTYIPGFGPPRDYATANTGGFFGGNPDFTPFLQGAPIAPDPNETGWKDTIRVMPFQVTRLAIRFAPQGTALATARPGVNSFSFDPTTGGPGYVWHCHILDHEDNEMMRPYLMQR